MIIGCYTLHLYCDHEECRHDMTVGKKTGPHEIIGETYQECAKQARRKGWSLSRDR